MSTIVEVDFDARLLVLIERAEDEHFDLPRVLDVTCACGARIGLDAPKPSGLHALRAWMKVHRVPGHAHANRDALVAHAVARRLEGKKVRREPR